MRNEGLHRTKEISSGMVFLWIITSRQRLLKTHQRWWSPNGKDFVSTVWKNTKMDRLLQLNAKEERAGSAAESTTKLFSGKHRRKKFLKTFMATVAIGNKTVKAAVLLDDGSSDTFCTLNLEQKLQLPTTSHQWLSISYLDRKIKRTNVKPHHVKDKWRTCSPESNCCTQDLYTESSPALSIQKRRRTEGQAYCGTCQRRKENRPPHRIRHLILRGKRWIHPTKQWNSHSRNQCWISCLWWPTQCSTDRQLLHNNIKRSHCYRRRTHQKTTAALRMNNNNNNNGFFPKEGTGSQNSTGSP